MKEKFNSKVLDIIILVLLTGAVVFALVVGDRYKKHDNVRDDTLVRVDASLATQPLMDAYVEGLKDYNLKKDYTNTDPAYTKLINGETDLIIVTEPSSDELKRASDAGVELEVTPVVNEGFVFFTNVNNLVNGLSLKEIQDIYTDKITNWNQVGGDNAKIIAYQRPENSGSQTGMLSLVMKDKKIKEPKREEYIESMAGIIDAVANYDNSKDSIGYSYYYYATTMYGNENIKFLAVDGVSPNHDTIKDESYPLITAYYIVTLKGTENGAVNKVKKAMLESKGQEIARNAGYIEIN
ncbi:MAG: substrate-binding domain-containing protein [Bacilli bacterium]|nr:substrate-binding domain-containing protein [Bacilli bacterium]